MTLAQIERRVKALEERLDDFGQAKPPVSRRWYRTQAGRFADDPTFDEIIKFGRSYRKSQLPRRRARRS